MTRFVYDDGGWQAAGKELAAPIERWGDCLVRAVAIVLGRPYLCVCDAVVAQASSFRAIFNGVTPQFGTRFLSSIGMKWTACYGTLTYDELPAGRHVVDLREAGRGGHFTAVIDGVLHDTDPALNDGRGVYGWWTPESDLMHRLERP